MKKALSDIEILAWNDRLTKTGGFNMFMVNPVYTDKSIYPSIAIREIAKMYDSPNWGSDLYKKPTREDNNLIIDYDFSFSLPIEKEELFESIYLNLSSDIILNLVGDMANFRTINVDNLNIKQNKVYHRVFTKNYIRYDYTFNGPLPELMAYVKHIDDAIAFSMLDSKFNINDVVSLKDNKSKDLLITDLSYEKDKNKYYLFYLTKEILYDNNIILYGDVNKYNEKLLCNSRSDIIDNLIGE